MNDVVSKVTDGNFEQEVVKSEKPVGVDFCAPWYRPCYMIEPATQKLAEEVGRSEYTATASL